MLIASSRPTLLPQCTFSHVVHAMEVISAVNVVVAMDAVDAMDEVLTMDHVEAVGAGY